MERAAREQRGAAAAGEEPVELAADARAFCADAVSSALCGLVRFLETCAVGEAPVLRESFEACGRPLAELLRSEALAPGKVLYAARAVELLVCAAPEGERRAMAKTLGLPLLVCVLRCGDRPDARALFFEAMGALAEVVAFQSDAAGLEDILRSELFGRLMKLLQRELLTLSIRLSGSHPVSAEGLLVSDRVPAAAVSDCDMLHVLTSLVCALHACPPAWAAATALRKKKTPYVLIALLLRIPPFQPAAEVDLTSAHIPVVARACRSLSNEMIRLASARDGAGWTRFIKAAFIDDGCYSALVALLQSRKFTELWEFGVGVLVTVVQGSSEMHQDVGVPLQIRPVDDKVLLGALVANLHYLLPRIAAGTGVVQYANVYLVSSISLALGELCVDGSGGTEFAGRLAVAKSGATKAALHALIAFNSLSPSRIVGSVLCDGEVKPFTVDETSEMLMLARKRVIGLVFMMSTMPSELIKFLAVPGAANAVAASTCASYLLTSGTHGRITEQTKVADRVVAIGLHSLAIMAGTNEKLASQIPDAKESGDDVVKLARLIVAEATWPAQDSQSSVRSTEHYALMYLSNSCRAQGGAVGRACAIDVRMVKGILRAIALGEQGRDPVSFTLTFKCFGNMTRLRTPREVYCGAWQKCGVFRALPSAVMDSKDPISVGDALEIAITGSNWYGDGERGGGERGMFELAKAAMRNILEAGILRLLNRRDVETCCRGGAEMVSILKSNFSAVASKTGAAGAHREEETLTGDGFNYVPDLSTGGVDSISFPAVTPDRLGGTPGEHHRSRVLASVLDPSRMHWVCSNPGCGAVGSETVRLLHCGNCRVAHYCSAACSRIDYPVHKITCAGRPKK